jgi:parallel beta-helix repeat protein
MKADLSLDEEDFMQSTKKLDCDFQRMRPGANLWRSLLSNLIRKIASKKIATLNLIAMLALAVTPVMASDLCGSTIVTDVVLDQDLTCTGNGLTVGADGIKINLNGHTITGPGSAIASVRGISLNQRNSVSIRGGTIRNFESGVFVANSSEITIKEILFTENREGVFLNGSSASTVKENTAWRNQIRGIMVRPSATRSSTDNVIKENLVVENPVGILVFGQHRNTLKENRISWSSQAGILLTGSGASGNLVKENLIGSSAAGIEFAVSGWTGNTFVENRILANTCAVKSPSDGNSFRENLLEGNASDSCP